MVREESFSKGGKFLNIVYCLVDRRLSLTTIQGGQCCKQKMRRRLHGIVQDTTARSVPEMMRVDATLSLY